MLDAAEEARFAELKEMCRELKVPAPPEIMIGLQVHEGGVLTFDDIQRGHSWTRNYWNALFIDFGAGPFWSNGTWGAGYLTIKSTSDSSYNNVLPNAATISIGTGDTAFSVEQYNLAAPIVSGTGSGQMSYVTQAAATAAYTSGTKTWKTTMFRVFNNNSGSSITVKETGLFGDQGGGRPSIWERSVLSPTVAVANGAQLTVTYAISMDFSAID